MLIHASCVAIDGKGILLAGPSGSGKSDLALRLIDEGAVLVSDDQTELNIIKDTLTASFPASIKGLIEIRHIGLLRLTSVTSAPLFLYVDLMAANETIERLAEEDYIHLMDLPLRRIKLPAFAASTPAKIRAILNYPAGFESE